MGRAGVAGVATELTLSTRVPFQDVPAHRDTTAGPRPAVSANRAPKR